jgi:hypothetical protein
MWILLLVAFATNGRVPAFHETMIASKAACEQLKAEVLASVPKNSGTELVGFCAPKSAYYKPELEAPKAK